MRNGNVLEPTSLLPHWDQTLELLTRTINNLHLYDQDSNVRMIIENCNGL